jgi:hypothetical protein
MQLSPAGSSALQNPMPLAATEATRHAETPAAYRGVLAYAAIHREELLNSLTAKVFEVRFCHSLDAERRKNIIISLQVATISRR